MQRAHSVTVYYYNKYPRNRLYGFKRRCIFNPDFRLLKSTLASKRKFIAIVHANVPHTSGNQSRNQFNRSCDTEFLIICILCPQRRDMGIDVWSSAMYAPNLHTLIRNKSIKAFHTTWTNTTNTTKQNIFKSVQFFYYKYLALFLNCKQKETLSQTVINVQ